MNATDNRIVQAAASKDEEAVDRAIRPKKLADYVGQEQVKAQLEIFVQAAVKRGEALDHALIFGPIFETLSRLRNSARSSCVPKP